ncbi:tRNA1(Val) (adenine(37)-N6)-methyltransferase [Plebeiibacterium sediminum]|uniref:tRNA1(Val) (adenine(37)-N6)-methyltransferase n=1 Tax=Plebeiibacterium sediminum TaxID=2992112 RepID=A0AAE3M6F0_9BACT|nr:methyltransferase [Plebeiobacterium sediminum]MCW3787836.1 methyltransferase [Plebeiobacterium sediminum]
MANSYFKFKQFTVEQGLAAMKVGTDGVLLGAWCNCMKAKTILDVGTGTGLIALMCAQRNQKATIDAVEIEKQAYSQALLNVNNSLWEQRIKVINDSFQNYIKQVNDKYDLIVSNPPFFNDSLKNDCHKKSLARHTDTLSFEELILGVITLLDEEGIFSVVLPSDLKTEFTLIAEQNGLFLNRILHVKPTPSKAEKRILLEFGKNPIELEENTMILEEFGRHGYSEYYKELTKDFYLKF